MTTLTTPFAFAQNYASTSHGRLGSLSARRQGVMVSIVLGLIATSGCAAAIAPEEGEQEVAGLTDSLSRGGGGVGGASFSCTSGTCTCDKSIENDCEDMTSACTDATVDNVINCINGWLVTHCTCTQMLTGPNPTGPTNLGVKALSSQAKLRTAAR
jgi:hypothetical protein